MGTVFKKTVTKVMPANAERFTKKGQRWVRWIDAKGKTRTAAVTIGNDGSERLSFESRTYYAKYRDGAGIVRVVATGCKDETAARSVLADLERRGELVKAGLMTSAEESAIGFQCVPMVKLLEVVGSPKTGPGDMTVRSSRRRSKNPGGDDERTKEREADQAHAARNLEGSR